MFRELLAKAEQADSTPLEAGLTIPHEVQRRQERKAKLTAARAEIEARAKARAAAEMAEYQVKLAERAGQFGVGSQADVGAELETAKHQECRNLGFVAFG